MFATAVENAVEFTATRLGVAPAYTITLENPSCGGHGLHANVLLHSPTNDAERAFFHGRFVSVFKRRFRWKTARNATYTPIKIEPALLGDTNAHRALTYHLKGCDDATAHAVLTTPKAAPGLDPILRDRFHPNHLREPQGTIHGPRVIIAPSISKEARQKAGYTDTATLADPIQPFRARQAKLRAMSEARQEAGAPMPKPAQVAASPVENANTSATSNTPTTAAPQITSATKSSAHTLTQPHPHLEHQNHAQVADADHQPPAQATGPP
ncbi:hypothetical protein GXW78_24025 [Roseomonas terrae]|uniref:Uncharacterized protein n=2 Tax=Neoroseomonas terrae TaxID=424799 RepID=A0ABS5EP01_9PROT|nr:hypothetical protein [Neoroseomonas terrae]